MVSLLKMLLYVILYKVWAELSKRKGLYWKSVARVALHVDGSCSIRRIGANGYEEVEGFPWLLSDTRRIVKWFVGEFKEIFKEHRPHHEIFVDRMNQSNKG